VKYTPPGSTISLSAVQDGEAVRVTVEDDGPGIPAESLPHIFEKFYRVSGGGAGRPGTGLGLAIARGLVEAHGGRITAESPPPGKGRGTAFTFWLPLTVPSAAAGAGANAGAMPAARGLVEGGATLPARPKGPPA
jgi:two-component system sensor histidine kinase KdpD